MDKVPWASVSGVQCAPPSVDFQTPPSAAPRKSAPSGAAASAVRRPATQRSPAPELLELPLLVASMYCGESEKSTPLAGLVRSVQAPPVVGNASACACTAAYASGLIARFGA